MTFDRIRNPESYRDGQPDLDVYNPCFRGLMSPRFSGTDVDGVFVLLTTMQVHGMWERKMNFLFLEHKAALGSFKLGQWLALNSLAAQCGDTGVRVIVTLGEDPSAPDSYLWLPVSGWRDGPKAAARNVIAMSVDDVRNNPVRHWAEWVNEGRRK